MADATSRLRASSDVLGAALGFRVVVGPGRLHDLFVTLEAMTPGEYKQQGAGLRIVLGFQPTPLGEAFLATTACGLCALEFTDDRAREAVVQNFRTAWPRAEINVNWSELAGVARRSRIFGERATSGAPLRVLVRGTNFQVQVWRAPLRVPAGGVTSMARWRKRTAIRVRCEPWARQWARIPWRG